MIGILSAAPIIHASGLLYRILAQALSYPDPDYVGRLLRLIGDFDLELMGNQDLEVEGFLKELNNLAQLPLDQVQGEHTRLFINAYPKVPCPPYESVYREGVLLGQAAEDVFEYYQRWGVNAGGDEVDHAGAELEFLAFLIALETPEAQAEAEQFMNDHIMAWLPRFSADLERESRFGFYRELGKMMTNILRTYDIRQ